MLIKNNKANVLIIKTKRFKTSFYCVVVSLSRGPGPHQSGKMQARLLKHSTMEAASTRPLRLY